ncbi:gap junction delta-2 protein [Eucyclogobius newberryi]|uniref:gap junction delta-2 protein n=1 Tax=Eucyclogobius newberryi TaxID=166745 RepID=UPI003B5AD349
MSERLRKNRKDQKRDEHKRIKALRRFGLCLNRILTGVPPDAARALSAACRPSRQDQSGPKQSEQEKSGQEESEQEKSGHEHSGQELWVQEHSEQEQSGEDTPPRLTTHRFTAPAGCLTSTAMGEWTILERLLEAAVQQHSTMIGRILLTVVVIFRILIVAIVGETVYEDEQTMFICNTLQPGCNQACYDKAFPISHIRYWVFQIILVCTPSLCFITYSVHQSAKQKDRRYSFLYPIMERDYGRDGPRKLRNINGILVQHGGDGGGGKEEADCLEVKEIPNAPRGLTHGKSSKVRRQEGISRFYIIQVVFRNALEIGFLAGQYFLYGFSVPGIFECDRYPCLKEVECYVSRPTEKTVFLVFMFAVSGICVVLNLAELNHLGWRKIKAAIRGVQARRKSICEIRKKDMAHLSQPPNLGRTQSSESAYV